MEEQGVHGRTNATRAAPDGKNSATFRFTLQTGCYYVRLEALVFIMANCLLTS